MWVGVMVRMVVVRVVREGMAAEPFEMGRQAGVGSRFSRCIAAWGASWDGWRNAV